MDDDLTPEQRFASETSEPDVPRALMHGRDPADLVAELVRLGWSPAAAQKHVDSAAEDLRRFQRSPESRRQLIAEAFRQFVAGILTVVLGIGVAVFSILMARGGVGKVFIGSLGLCFVGLIVAGRGWARWQLYRRDRLPFDPPSEGE